MQQPPQSQQMQGRNETSISMTSQFTNYNNSRKTYSRSQQASAPSSSNFDAPIGITGMDYDRRMNDIHVHMDLNQQQEIQQNVQSNPDISSNDQSPPQSKLMRRNTYRHFVNQAKGRRGTKVVANGKRRRNPDDVDCATACCACLLCCLWWDTASYHGSHYYGS